MERLSIIKMEKDVIFINGAIKPSFIAENIAYYSAQQNVGGYSIFIGQIRKDLVDGHFVEAIEYTTYEDLALSKINEIRTEVAEKYVLQNLEVYHSMGIIQAGEICLFVIACAGHRKPAMEACTEAVERIKAEVPIWGKEIFENSAYQWKQNS
jgi:molybdopterin synthase catalytic subunit